MGTLVAVINRKGEDATQTAAAMLMIMNHGNAEAFGIASPQAMRTEKSPDALQDLDIDSQIIVGYLFSRTLNQDRTQPIQVDNAALVFEGRLFPPVAGMSDAEAVAARLPQPREKTVKALIKDAEGDFALAIAESERLITGRDSFGSRPLYYGENAQFAALASERKALWRIGIENPVSFPPGHIAAVNANGFTFKPAREPGRVRPPPLDMQTASDRLLALLQASVTARVTGVEEIAVAFSGGLDSTVIALLAKRAGIQVHLIHVSLRNRPETSHAKQTAQQLKLLIDIDEYTTEDIEQTLPHVLWAIEEADPIKTSIGIPIYWAAEKAAEMKLKVMLAGQGADELFGGYKRYVDTYLRFGIKRATRDQLGKGCQNLCLMRYRAALTFSHSRNRRTRRIHAYRAENTTEAQHTKEAYPETSS
jgi:asparagine synthase (glutamine-hydrolysing)